MPSQLTLPAQPELDEQAGEVKSIVLLYGLFGGLSNWQSTREFFQDGYRIAAIDFNLYDPKAPYQSVDSLAAMTLRFMDEQGIKRAAVFGNSLGGHVALFLALKHPERVAGLVLTGSAGLVERGYSLVPSKPDFDYAKKRVGEVFYDKSFASDELVNEVLTVIKSNRNKLRIIRLARNSRRQNMLDHLPDVRVPALLVWGMQDEITPPDTGRTFAALIPDARLMLLDECGHSPNIEKPEEFNSAAEAFLDGIGY